jgi:hypothetical protein
MKLRVLMTALSVSALITFTDAGRSAETPACLPPALSAWAQPATPITTARTEAEAVGRPLPLGQRIAFRLANTESITFAQKPSEQMPKQYVYSGMAAFRVQKDGTYSVMIGEANWIDVIQEGRTIRSLQMGPRLECVRYGKKIEFPLKAGTAIVQFFGAPYDTVDVLVTPTP